VQSLIHQRQKSCQNREKNRGNKKREINIDVKNKKQSQNTEREGDSKRREMVVRGRDTMQFE
jgi:hypothetical protein